MSKQKAPKTLQESYVFVEQALRDFGIAGGLAVRDLIEFSKVGLKHSNAAVRTQATKCLVTLKLFVGPSQSPCSSTFPTLSKGSIGISSHIALLHVDITSFLSDLTPQLLSTIESDFEKVADEAAPTPTRIGADTVVATPAASASAGGTKGKAAAANDVDPMDELFPRVDFDRLVPGATVSALGDANWKVRKEAVEAIRDVLEANKRIKPTTLREFQVLVRIRNSSLIEAGLNLQRISLVLSKLESPTVTRSFSSSHSMSFLVSQVEWVDRLEKSLLEVSLLQSLKS